MHYSSLCSEHTGHHRPFDYGKCLYQLECVDCRASCSHTERLAWSPWTWQMLTSGQVFSLLVSVIRDAIIEILTKNSSTSFGMSIHGLFPRRKQHDNLDHSQTAWSSILLWRFHINGVTHDVTFSICLLSLGTMFSRDICIAAPLHSFAATIHLCNIELMTTGDASAHWSCEPVVDIHVPTGKCRDHWSRHTT